MKTAVGYSVYVEKNTTATSTFTATQNYHACILEIKLSSLKCWMTHGFRMLTNTDLLHVGVRLLENSN